MKDAFGTQYVTSLNVAEGPHLVRDDQLRESFNGWTDEDGVWRPAPAPVKKWGPYTAISAMASGRMGGADHVVWLDGDTLYDNGANVGTITAGASMDIVALDDSFLIFGASKNYIWDGAVLREQGVLDAAYPTTFMLKTPTANNASEAKAITGISKASQAVILTDLLASVGGYIYIDGVVGMTEINGKVAKIVASDPGVSKTVDIDSTEFTDYDSDGTVYLGAAGLVGEYKYYVVATVRLPSGVVLESRPIGVKDARDSSSFTSEEPYVVTAAATDKMIVSGFLFVNVGGVSYFDCSGTIGTDYIPGLRLYRTKAGGYDFYLVNEWEHGDSGFTYTYSAQSMYYTLSGYTDQTHDRFLGAVYVPGNLDHSDAPAATTGDVSAQRCLINSQEHPDRVYWSGLDGIENFNVHTGWDKRPDAVTAIIGYRNGFVVFSCDRMWYCRFVDDLPSWEEIPTPVGTVWPKAVWVWRGSVVWLRDDGLWSWGGSGEPRKISRKAFSSIVSPQSVTCAGDRLYVSGSERAYVAISRDSGVEWHECDGSYALASGSNGKIYGASAYGVYELFSGTRRGGRLRSKHFGNTLQVKAVRCVVDMEGETVPTLWINGNRQSDTDGHDEETRHGEYGERKLARISVPRLNNQFVELMLEVTGDVKVYGYWIEVVGR